MSKEKPDALSVSLDTMLTAMMKDALDPDKGMLLDEKLKIADRVLKKKALDHKIKDGEFGSAFGDDD